MDSVREAVDSPAMYHSIALASLVSLFTAVLRKVCLFTMYLISIDELKEHYSI